MELDREIVEVIEGLTPEMINFRRDLHRHPELSQHEVVTTQRIQRILTSAGIKSTFISGNVGVIAQVSGKHPGGTFALRADIDALPVREQTNLPFASEIPEVMHACGHDVHTAVLAGTALTLAQYADRLHGNVRLIFQSSEEKLGGAIAAIKAGALDSPKVKNIVALHCWPDLDAGTIGLRHGPMMASSDEVHLIVRGVGGHAAHPHRTRDPIVALAHIICGLQTAISREISPLDSAVLSFGMLQSGKAPNVIPDYAEAAGTLRTLKPEIRDKLTDSIKRIASHIAQGLGTECEVVVARQCPSVNNNEALVVAAEECIKSALGPEQVKFLPEPSMGSEDFAYYLDHAPGMLMRLGTGNELQASRLSLHNSRIIFDEKAIGTGMKALCAFTLSQLAKEQN